MASFFRFDPRRGSLAARPFLNRCFILWIFMRDVHAKYSWTRKKKSNDIPVESESIVEISNGTQKKQFRFYWRNFVVNLTTVCECSMRKLVWAWSRWPLFFSSHNTLCVYMFRRTQWYQINFRQRWPSSQMLRFEFFFIIVRLYSLMAFVLVCDISLILLFFFILFALRISVSMGKQMA